MPRFSNLIFLLLATTTLNLIGQDDKEEPWLLQLPTNAQVKFEMPTPPRVRSREFPAVRSQPKIVVHLYNSVTKDGKASLVCSFHDLHQDASTPAIQNRILTGAAKGSIAQTMGMELKNEAIKFRRRYPARELLYLSNYKGVMHKVSSRLILVGNRLYNLSVVFPQDDFDDQVANRFFKSFELISEDYDLPPRPRYLKRRR